MRRLFSLIFQLILIAIVIFLGTAAWIVFDGLSDQGSKADVALVTGRSAAGTTDPRLDRVAQLYNQGEFPFVIVVGSAGPRPVSATSVTDYLETHGVPANAILEASRAENTGAMAFNVAEVMREHHFGSVMIVADYYRITRTKIALSHDGITEIEKAHAGNLDKDDAMKIGREVVALYEYVGKIYLMPAAEKVKQEAQVGVDKAKVDAEQAKQKVDKDLNGLSK